MVFHHGIELNQFYSQNTNYNPTHLYIVHGTAKIEKTGHIVHVPYFVFGDNTGKPILEDSGDGTRYGKQALDVGHGCPPHCDAVNDPRNICPGTATSDY